MYNNYTYIVKVPWMLESLESCRKDSIRHDDTSVNRTLTSMSHKAFRQARVGEVRFTYLSDCSYGCH